VIHFARTCIRSLSCAVLYGAIMAVPAYARDAPTPVAAEAPPSPVPGGPLTDLARPERYRIDLMLDPSREDFSGKVEIDAVLTRPTTFIDLHGRNLSDVQVQARTATGTITGTWTDRDPTGVARITFARALDAGPVTLVFDYRGRFTDYPAGLFRVKVGDDWYNWSQFESIDARTAFPSFDQPSFKTPFEVVIRTPPGNRAISNAPEIATTREEGLDVHRFAPTLPLPTYLVAIMTGPFALLEGAVAPTPQRSMPLPLRIVATQPNAGQLEFGLEGSKQIVTLLEDYFAGAFPYPKLDQVGSPILPGAMENAGAALYRDSLLFMDHNAPIPQQRAFGNVVSHELAHQWFGDLVTPAWWDDIWLNESFATWMGYRIGQQWRPDLNIASGAVQEGLAAMDTDSLIAGRPVRQRLDRNSQVDGAFDSITYGKGGHVVAMFAAFLGDNRFRDGVRRYIGGRRHGNATSTDFFAALAQAGGDPRIVPAMRSFIEQQGVPLLTFVHRDSGWQVTQQRYAAFGVQAPDTRWGVPLCARRGETRSCQLLDGVTSTIEIGGKGPLVPNAGGAGYYRFELAEADWAALIDGAAGLTGSEAQAVTDSLTASIRAGRARIVQLAALARSLSKHPDSYASDVAVDAMSTFVRDGLVGTSGRKAWSAFRGKLYAPLLGQYGFDPTAGAYAHEDPERVQRRVQIVERISGTPKGKGLRRRLLGAVDAYLAGNGSALDPSWFERGFAIYIDREGEKGARLLVDRALASEDPYFRPRALGAAASSGLKAVARWMLFELDDPRYRLSERTDMLASVMLMRSTRDIGYAWLDENFAEVAKAGGGIFLARRTPALFARYCSVAKADEIASLYRPRFVDTPGALALERSIEEVRNCGVLGQARGAEISADFADLN